MILGSLQKTANLGHAGQCWSGAGLSGQPGLSGPPASACQ